MAQYTIEIPAPYVADTVEAFAYHYKYQTTIEDAEGNQVANPESKNQFAKRMLLQYIKDIYKAYKLAGLASTRATIISDANTDTGTFTVSAG